MQGDDFGCGLDELEIKEGDCFPLLPRRPALPLKEVTLVEVARVS